jgi:hypothetical protein
MTDRAVRQFAVYTEGRLALVISDGPGTLRSAAGAPPPAGDPGPPGPPGTTDLPPGVHPFIDAEAYDPVSEGRLRELLDASAGFDDYLARLVDAGFDIASCRPDEGYDFELPPVVRLRAGSDLVGAVWPAPGQFTALARQPAEDELGSEIATATAYRSDRAEQILAAVQGAGSFEELLERLRAAGLVT